MQFITLDQRIAVENFEVGVVYTVAFTSGDNFTGSCIGIGADFVAFQRTAPELLFCLTMTTAADVASIESFGSDIGKILEYTGSVPTTIKADGSPLLDYLITGNTIQNGTPTPSTPIPVVGVGEIDNGQYKIPISSANTTTPVYLGEVQSTRRIKKLVLTGEEEYIYDPSYTRFYFVISNILGIGIRLTPLYCTHYQNISDGRPIGNVPNNSIYTGGGIDVDKVFIKTTDYTSVADFKAYLAQQYAAGTPVTVWYVLANEETAVVNEPLMKIGDYADTLSKTQAGVAIPTNNGLTTVDVDTTVKPSEVYLKYFSPLF